MRAYFDTARPYWESIPTDDRCFDLAQQLAVGLNAANFELREDPQHGIIAVNLEQERRAAALNGERQAIEDHAILTFFPMRCRQLLDERRSLNEAELATLWAQWTRIRESDNEDAVLPNGETRFGDEYVNAIAGGVAVFLAHANWTHQHGRYDEVVRVFRQIIAGDPSSSLYDDHDITMTYSAECFAADAAGILWLADPQNRSWREALADSICSGRRVVTGLAFSRIAPARESVATDFSRLRRLAMEWARIRRRMQFLERAPPEVLQHDKDALAAVVPTLESWQENWLVGFIEGTCAGAIADWDQLGDPEGFEALDSIARRRHEIISIDLGVIRASHEWLPLPDDALSGSERSEVAAFWQTAIRFITEREDARAGSRDGGHYPSDNERWVLERSAGALVQLHEGGSADNLWRLVLNLHEDADAWTEVLVRAMHRHALAMNRVPSRFVELVGKLLAHALTPIEGGPRWSWYERVWDALVGIDGQTRHLWESRHTPLVHSMRAIFFAWTRGVEMSGRRIASFCRWLALPAAAPLRFEMLSWLVELLRPTTQDHELSAIEECVSTA